MNQNFFDIKMNIIIKFKKNKKKEKKKEKIIKNYFQRKIYSSSTILIPSFSNSLID